MKIQLSELNASIRDIPLPDNMKHLPVSKKGFPVPFFASIVDGEWDFRVTTAEKFVACVKEKRCWICGQALGSKYAFVAGPMCVVTKTSAEPPCHLTCATYSAIACPFLAQPRMKRNESDLPEGHRPPAGVAIMRNPGVTAVLVTRKYKLFDDGDGRALVEMGDPEDIKWYAQRRPATQAEVMDSVTSGMPLLWAQCDQEESARMREEAHRELDIRLKAFARWLPPIGGAVAGSG
jgi:hypothetical protein